MVVHGLAHARIGLIGNPSDGYGGKTISAILRNYRAHVSIADSPTLVIEPQTIDRLEFDSIPDLLDTIRAHGYYGGVRIIKAAIKKFAQYCADHAIDLPDRPFTLRYDTNVPRRVGLAGSSAIVIAAFRALMAFHDVAIPDRDLPYLALSVEVEELNIPAGLQDRVVQTLEGAVFMDFAPERASEGERAWEQLDPALLPPLFVAYDEKLAEGTEVVHSDLRSRFNHGDAEVLAAMRQFADYAQQARDLLIEHRGAEILPLMDANFDLRAALVPIDPGCQRLVDTARAHGAAAKYTGSGGAIVGAYDGDPERLHALDSAFRAIGATLITPDTIGDQS
jgi:glucuronokinase